MDVVIVGGGIGGLATAAFLQQQGVAAQVYEQAPQLRPVGAGIVLAPNAVRLVRRLGVLPALGRRAVPVEVGWQFRRWEDGRVLLAQDMTRCESLYGESAWLVHRADLVDVLLAAIEPGTVHLGSRCQGVDVGDEAAAVTFADGSTRRADLVVAADGIHSAIRHALVGPMPARGSGLCAWRAMVPASRLPRSFGSPVQNLWLGPGRHLVHYPVSAGEAVNVVAFTPAGSGETEESWTAPGEPAGFRAAFAGWAEPVATLLDAVTEVGRWSVLDRPPLARYVHGRAVLLGDAAHPMLPFFAQGAGQAIEDAGALVAALCASTDVASALTTYDSVRVPRAALVQDASRMRAHTNHLPDGPEQQARDSAFATDDPLRHSDWLYGYDAYAEAGRAARLLDSV